MIVDCTACGTELEFHNVNFQPHCPTVECGFGYARRLAFENVEKVGDCEVWKGSIRKSDGGTPVVFVSGVPGLSRRDYRTLQLREKYPEDGKGRRYFNLCGTERCVRLDHHRRENAPLKLTISNHLPYAPLEPWVEHRELPQPHRDRRCNWRKRGWLTVTHADEVCIDVLNTHPADIYGWEFFDA